MRKARLLLYQFKDERWSLRTLKRLKGNRIWGATLSVHRPNLSSISSGGVTCTGGKASKSCRLQKASYTKGITIPDETLSDIMVQSPAGHGRSKPNIVSARRLYKPLLSSATTPPLRKIGYLGEPCPQPPPVCIPHQSICQTQDSPLALSSQTSTTSRRKKRRPSPQRMIVQIGKLPESRPIDSGSSRRRKPYYSTIYHTILLPQARHQQFLPDYIIYTDSHIGHLGCPRDQVPSYFSIISIWIRIPLNISLIFII